MPDDSDSIPAELLRFAERMGFSQRPDESDVDYIDRLLRMQGHIGLLVRAKRYGVKLTNAMTSREVHGAINHRLWELLAEHDVRESQQITFKGKRREVQRVYETDGTRQNPPEVRVQIWCVPWDQPNNRGRSQPISAVDLLRDLGVIDNGRS
ncbi:MAG TPA: hypothetical protein VLF59_06050 [Candidatus Saccharimonadales bacterium]|nr:hypothetical protein [Candidatus Saccharimonadales bacterium]